MREEFITALTLHQAAFGVPIPDEKIEHVSRFYEIILENNAVLHLVAPMPAAEFVLRHILESLTMLEHLPKDTRFADIGAGAGLPSIPCMIVREDLKAVLIESKVRKANYLIKAVSDLGIADRAKVVNLQFEEAKDEQFSVVACRALDKFTQKLPRLVKWSQRRTLLLFGGPSLREALQRQKLHFTEKLMPMSERRFLFVVSR